jgi:dTDP-4-amino-4,6-dideoxygalactose transaminase
MGKLAINNGKPLRKKSFSRWPIFDHNEIAALRKVINSGIWGIGGMKIKEFEEKFSIYQQAKYSVAVMNGTVGLEVALRAAGIKAGDEVIMPAYTFMATSMAALQVNALPVFSDINPNTYNLDPNKVEDLISDKTRAIIPVHLAGCPVDMDKINNVAKNNGIKVIEDACQAWGSEWKGRRVGAIGDLGVFSFQSSKNITSGEGGIIITNNRKLYELCWAYQNCGRLLKGSWYQHELLGFNYRMTEFQAAVLLIQHTRFDKQTKMRNDNALYLSRELSKIKGIEPLKRSKNVTRHAYHLYIFKYHKEEFEGLSRNKFVEALNAEGIPSSPGYNIPLHKQKSMLRLAKDPFLQRLFGKKIDYKNLRLPETEKASLEEGIWIKQNVLLGTKEDMNDIINAIIKIKENIEELSD